MQIIPNGVLAHLARARHWQCRGERFESAILHQSEPILVRFCYIIINYLIFAEYEADRNEP